MIKTNRVIIDVNLWISYLISSTIDPLLPLIKTGKITLLFSEELMTEFIEVANRPKFKKYFTSTDLAELVTLINEISSWVNISSNVTICRDPKDNYLLSIAKDGEANYLVTGDDDLLVLQEFEKTKICTFSQFMSLIE